MCTNKSFKWACSDGNNTHTRVYTQGIVYIYLLFFPITSLADVTFLVSTSGNLLKSLIVLIRSTETVLMNPDISSIQGENSMPALSSRITFTLKTGSSKALPSPQKAWDSSIKDHFTLRRIASCTIRSILSVYTPQWVCTSPPSPRNTYSMNRVGGVTLDYVLPLIIHVMDKSDQVWTLSNWFVEWAQDLIAGTLS